MNDDKDDIDPCNLLRFCNKVLYKDPESVPYVNLDNNVFLFNHIIESIENLNVNLSYKYVENKDEIKLDKNDEDLKKMAKSCANYVRSCTKVDEYIKQKRKEYEMLCKRSKFEHDETDVDGNKIDLIEISDDDIKIDNNNDVSMKAEDHIVPKTTPSLNNTKEEMTSESEMIVETEPTLNDEELQEFKVRLRRHLDESDIANLKQLLIELINKNNACLIKEICLHLSNSFTTSDVESAETQLNKIAECLISINSTTIIMSYSVSVLFLKDLFSNYFTNINKKQEQTVIEQINLSKRSILICSNLCKHFPDQFIETCIVEWLKNTNTNNKSNIEFIVKFIKDLFNEANAYVLLKFMLNSYSNNDWNENIYVLVLSIFEKISNLGINEFNLIINKMKNDCEKFTKSVFYAKILSFLINKQKLLFSDQRNNNQDNSNNIIDELQTNLIQENLRYMVDKNQTLMKKTLTTSLDRN